MTRQIKSLFKKLERRIGSPTEAMAPSTKSMAPDPKLAPFDPVVAEVFRHRKHVGVNLGGVFCLEGWLAPPTLRSTAVPQGWQSEIEFLGACSSREAAREALEDHWQHWGVTEADFGYLASVGINAVRVPIGYWIVAGRDPELVASPFKHYLGVYDTAMHWLLTLIASAAKYDIGVLVDVHGAPGGQNGDSHCGVSTRHAQFFRFGSQHNQSIMLKIYQKLAKLLAPINNVIGLELLNEPQDDTALMSFYIDAIKAIRQAVPDIQLPIYIGDCWRADKYSEFVAALNSSNSPLDFFVLDTHQYFCHTPADHAKSADQHTKHLTSGLKTHLQQVARRIRGNLVVGEWSVVLNGASIPADEHDGQVMKTFGECEQKVWNDVAAGQFYWNYKTTDDGWYWSFVYCQKNHILPSNMGGFIRATTTDTSDEQKEKWLNEAFDQHVQYWSSQDGAEAIVRDAWHSNTVL
ncbi:glycoside hydrolase superfamily [Dichotomocladium elegans]|nr:glycoside hydrolase superfamily [Dichotomocladium elegans]